MLTGKPLDRRKSPRIETKGSMPGKIYDVSSNVEIDCRSIDVSHIGLAIEASVDLPLGGSLRLEVSDRRIILKVVSKVAVGNTPPPFRYGLLVEDANHNLEEIFARKDLLARRAPENKHGMTRARFDRSPRFLPDKPTRVEASTFGVKSFYSMTIENLSRSGILVGYIITDYLPFQVGTILDLVIDPQKTSFPKPVRATAKIVRRVDESVNQEPDKKNAVATRIGLVIIEVDPADEMVWMETFDLLESTL